jgi:hypothetical protein
MRFFGIFLPTCTLYIEGGIFQKRFFKQNASDSGDVFEIKNVRSTGNFI